MQTLLSTSTSSFPISKIVPADKELLYNAVMKFRPNSKNYEDSWGYVIQATRNHGFKVFDPKTESLVFFGNKAPHDKTLVVPAFCAKPEYLQQVVRKVQIERKAPSVILKNVNMDDVNSYYYLGFREYTDDESWSKQARFDDQTYPQLIVDLKKLAEARGTKYENLRSSLRKARNLEIRVYRKSDKANVLEIFTLKDKYSKNPQMRQGKMYASSHAMYPSSDTDKSVILDKQSQKIVGFTAVSVISPKIVALVASGFRPDAQNVSLWGIYQTLVGKYHEGYKFASLGGCEYETTYRFKKEKFRPVEEIRKTHLLYDPNINKFDFNL